MSGGAAEVLLEGEVGWAVDDRVGKAVDRRALRQKVIVKSAEQGGDEEGRGSAPRTALASPSSSS